MFNRRVYILLGVFLLAGTVVLGRLAQVQLLWHDRFQRETYTRAGGNRTVDTVRGGIYTRWGTPLAVQQPSFDLGVHYDLLVLGCVRPWDHREVQQIIDEYARRVPAALDAGLGEQRYRTMWSRRQVPYPGWGSLENYARRRVAGETWRDIHADPEPSPEPQDWRITLARLTDTTVAKLTEKAEETVQKVERVQRRVQAHSGYDPNENYVRIVEQTQHHVVVRDVPREVAARVRTQPQHYPGIRVIEGTRRRYPNGGLAPHIVGRTRPLSPSHWESLTEAGEAWTMNMPVAEIGSRYLMDDKIGESGIEKQYEHILRGARGYVQNRLVFKVLNVEKQSTEAPPAAGDNVYLTLREDFQSAANAALHAAAQGSIMRAGQEEPIVFERGALVILEVDSGAILAAATWPTYDMESYDDRKRFRDILQNPFHPLVFRPLQGALPTGSVYKVITAIAGLQEGRLTTATTFLCEGSRVYQGRAFHCTARWGHKNIQLAEAIEKSCNIYFYETGLRVGGDALAQWGKAFGLGVPSGVDWPYVRSGNMPRASATFEVLNLSIGQGDLLATPLQVANAMAAVANGGRLYQPHFLDHVANQEGELVRSWEPTFRQIDVRPDVLQAVRHGMRLVVESGTASETGLEPFRAAGKTGTAELGRTGLNHAWFAGYAPYENPKIAFAVVNERSDGGHGGDDAAPIVADCLNRIRVQLAAMR